MGLVEIPGPAAGGGVQEDGGGHADVEALDEAAHGDADAAGAGRGDGGPDALALVAEDEGEAGEVAQVFGGEVAFGVGGDQRHAGGLGPGEQRGGAVVAGDVDPLLGAAGDGVGDGEGGAGALHDVQVLDAEGVAGAEHGGAVVGVVRAVEDDGDRVAAAARGRRRCGPAGRPRRRAPAPGRRDAGSWPSARAIRASSKSWAPTTPGVERRMGRVAGADYLTACFPPARLRKPLVPSNDAGPP